MVPFPESDLSKKDLLQKKVGQPNPLHFAMAVFLHGLQR
jgi:hypothetical protein